jgi:hypothetical protein
MSGRALVQNSAENKTAAHAKSGSQNVRTMFLSKAIDRLKNPQLVSANGTTTKAHAMELFVYPSICLLQRSELLPPREFLIHFMTFLWSSRTSLIFKHLSFEVFAF